MRPEHDPPAPQPYPDPRPNPPTVPNPDPNQPTQPEVPQIDPPEVVPPSIPEKPDLPPAPHSDIQKDPNRVPNSPVFDPELATRNDTPETGTGGSKERAGEAGNREETSDDDEGNAYEWNVGGDDVRELVIEPPLKHDSDARPQ